MLKVGNFQKVSLMVGIVSYKFHFIVWKAHNFYCVKQLKANQGSTKPSDLNFLNCWDTPLPWAKKPKIKKNKE